MLFGLTRTPFVAAASQIQNVFVTNWPSLFKTKEQNLDTKGNIKIHEQGTANVNIVNTSPIQVQNVGGSPTPTPLQPEVIKVFDNQAIPTDPPTYSNFIDVQGYKKVAIFADTPVIHTTTGNSLCFLNTQVDASIDGVTDYVYTSVEGTPQIGVYNFSGHLFTPGFDITTPYLRLKSFANCDVSIPTTISLYLQP